MGRRALAWILVTPIAAAGVLATHALAYSATGTATGPAHDYLAHAPQVVGLLASIGLVGLGVQERSLCRSSAWWFVPLAPAGFVCQEHVERLAHTGDLPWLLTTPAFLLGLLLQVPVALVCVLVVRRVVGTIVPARSVPRAPAGEAWLPLPTLPVPLLRAVWVPRPSGRSPPALLTP